MRTVRIAVLISMAAMALLVLPDAASARWKTLNGPLIQNTGTGFCICKDGMRVEISFTPPVAKEKSETSQKKTGTRASRNRLRTLGTVSTRSLTPASGTTTHWP